MCEMVEEISSFRERFRAEEIVELVLYQPHPTGWTPLHVSSLLNNSHATQLLLEHGANPYVQDTEHFSITQYSHSIHTVSIILYQILWFSSPLRAHRGIPVILVMSVIMWHEKTKVRKIIGCGDFDIFSVKTIIHNNNKKMGHLIWPLGV